MNFGGAAKWVEAHPGESIIIGTVGLLAVLWILGVFSSAPAQSSSSAGSANMAAAYYAAEAQQAVVGGQIQMANIAANASTAQAQLAVQANATNANAATIINGQNADASTTIGQQGLNATLSNNSTALGITQSNNATALTTDWINNILPSEFALYGAGKGFQTQIPGVSGTFASWYTMSPNEAAAAGYGPQAIANLGG